MALVDIQVPDIGDFDEVAVIELLVKVGDTVKAEQSLITVESDKASMEIPSSGAGVVKELLVKLGDKVKQGVVIARLDSDAAPAEKPAAPAAASAPESKPAPAAAAAPAPAADSSGPVKVLVPDIGDFKDVAVIEVLVKVGDTVKLEQSLVTVESDKASMEIPSNVAGVVKEITVQLGDKINIGDPIAVVQASGAAAPTAAAAPAPAATSDKPDAPAATPAPAPAAGTPAAAPAAAHDPSAPVRTGLPHASPSVRKFARELGVPLEEVKGSGAKGRITAEDVQAFTRAVMSGASQTRAAAAKGGAGSGADSGAALGLIPWPKVDFSKFGPIERKDMSRIKKISGANLHRNWVMIPHVTNHDDADITDLEAFRVSTNKENEKSGVKVTMLAFLIKACVAALRKFPEFNASIDGEQLVYKQYYHIGFAADTPNGLMVPVIKDADKKGIMQISQEMGELAKKARDGKLSPGEMSGASFTISSLGGIGGRYFTPIINAPEVAILGVCRSTMEPVWDGKAFAPRLMLPLSLSWDHRVIDGAAAARFNVYLGQILGDFRRVLL
ncbi:MAG: dihydrolipoyllysine-residue acetyltransferase [Rhodoferax sp.]|nr:dihydrolipoyllysine-residue acetyltransferase [Rhodoferax sp.]